MEPSKRRIAVSQFDAGPPLFLFMPKAEELHRMIIKSSEYTKAQEVPV